ncbi:uncharacterized protein LOC101864566 [Aplysia californica]|uniref:Uncharacterized protein LOC101864566 n=1 Tax=Aplysia californica TaxID=6500 RepID=A0ABM0K6L7_APLCA|nr:uncharacterized protein LOC101864566 [Aplysia californica]
MSRQVRCFVLLLQTFSLCSSMELANEDLDSLFPSGVPGGLTSQNPDTEASATLSENLIQDFGEQNINDQDETLSLLANENEEGRPGQNSDCETTLGQGCKPTSLQRQVPVMISNDLFATNERIVTPLLLMAQKGFLFAAKNDLPNLKQTDTLEEVFGNTQSGVPRPLCIGNEACMTTGPETLPSHEGLQQKRDENPVQYPTQREEPSFLGKQQWLQTDETQNSSPLRFYAMPNSGSFDHRPAKRSITPWGLDQYLEKLMKEIEGQRAGGSGLEDTSLPEAGKTHESETAELKGDMLKASDEARLDDDLSVLQFIQKQNSEKVHRRLKRSYNAHTFDRKPSSLLMEIERLSGRPEQDWQFPLVDKTLESERHSGNNVQSKIDYFHFGHNTNDNLVSASKLSPPVDSKESNKWSISRGKRSTNLKASCSGGLLRNKRMAGAKVKGVNSLDMMVQLAKVMARKSWGNKAKEVHGGVIARDETYNQRRDKRLRSVSDRFAKQMKLIRFRYLEQAKRNRDVNRLLTFFLMCKKYGHPIVINRENIQRILNPSHDLWKKKN